MAALPVVAAAVYVWNAKGADMKSSSILGAAILTSLWVASAASAVSTGGLRCGTRLVSLGDTPYEVQAICGPPDARQQRTEVRAVQHQVRVPCADGRRGACTARVENTIEVAVEEWLYDFGPRRFAKAQRKRLIGPVNIEQGERGNIIA